VKAPPSHGDVGGARYLALRKRALALARPTAELLQRYALEGFLARLANSRHRARLVLKGGVLLAAFDLRRATRDIDLLALGVDNDPAAVGALIAEIAAVEVDDGLEFFPTTLDTAVIRDGDLYPGVRVRLVAHLATARLRLQVDVNVGDPIAPRAELIEVPALLAGPGPRVLGYSRAMVIAEKLVTALQRGAANTRWRDFADLFLLLTSDAAATEPVALSLAAVARHRGVDLVPLGEALTGMPAVAQRRWEIWARQQGIEARVPRSFAELLQAVDERTRGWVHEAAAKPEPPSG
jgi:hypothetical protein